MTTATTTTAKRNELNVALLLSELPEARSLTASFRKIGVVPSFYDSLQTFWNATIEDNIDFAVIDIKLMSEGQLVLANHPRVVDGSLPLAFWYSDANSPLLHSTYDVPHFGTIRKSLSYDGQLKAILNLVNRMRDQINLSNALRQKAAILQSKNAKLIGNIHDYKEKTDLDMIMRGLVNQIEKNAQTMEFGRAVLDTLTEWLAVQSLAIYELSGNGQRLVSSTYQVSKAKELASLWPGQICRDGIETFALNMAVHVAKENLGTNVVTLKITGAKKNPDMLLFVQLQEEGIANFNWSLFELLLSGVYRQHVLATTKEQSRIRDRQKPMNPWELLGLLDAEFHTVRLDIDTAETASQLIDIRLTKLTTAIKARPAIRFYWDVFAKDFLMHLGRNVHSDFSIAHWGIDHIAVVVERKHFDEAYRGIKGFASRFSYWRYFEDSTSVLSLDLAADVRALPFVPAAYLRHTDERPATTTEITTTTPTRRTERSPFIVHASGPQLDA